MNKQIIGAVLDYLDSLPNEHNDISTEDLSEELDFLEDYSYVEGRIPDIYVFGGILQDVGNIIQNKVSQHLTEELEESEDNIRYNGRTIYLRNYYDDIYPKDKQLNKYEKLVDKKKQELKELKDSLKNRQNTLKDEGKVLRTVKSKSIVVQ